MSRFPSFARGRATGLVALVASLLLTAVDHAAAQYLDARVLGRGVLRVSFEPSYTSYDRRFDADGNQEPLGTDLTFDSAGVGFLPSLDVPQGAVRSILQDPTYRMNLGAVRHDLDADVRHFPFNAQFGLTDRISLTASIPIVTTRMQVASTLDSTDANVGWNQVALESGNSLGRSQTIELLSQLTTAFGTLDALIATGAFDCPSGPTCQAAQSLVTRTQVLRDQLSTLTGVDVAGTVSATLPPATPLATSVAGQAILASIQGIGQELASFGVQSVTATLPLPTAGWSAEDVNTVLTTAGFGYDALPLTFVKLTQRLGDLELGVRWGLIQQPSVRVALSTAVRLPTAILDSPANFVDIGSGDKQLDIIGGVELVLEPGSVVSLGLGAEYTYQAKSELLRRVTSTHTPVALAATEFNVSRDLGDVLRLRAFPGLRLHPNLLAYGSLDYLYKQSDVYAFAASADGGTAIVDITDLELDTAMRRLNVGGGLHYRSVNRAGGLPVEAGLHYAAAFQGRGGLTPMTTGMSLYLRLFYRLFGGPPRPPGDSSSAN